MKISEILSKNNIIREDRITGINFPAYLSVPDRTIRVMGYLEDFDTEDLEEGKGYILWDNFVYIYNPNLSNSTMSQADRNCLAFNFLNDYKEIIFLKFNKFKEFNAENVYNADLNQIINDTSKDDVYYDAKQLMDIQLSSTIYIPTIEEDDDFLKKIIKTFIIDTRVNVRALKSKGSKEYTVSNLITGLNNKTKMSVTSFLRWCELLGLKFNMDVQSNNLINIIPSDYRVHYESGYDNLTTENKPVFNNEEEYEEEE